MAILPGGVATTEAIGPSSKPKGIIRSWKNLTWHSKRNKLMDFSGIPSGEAIGLSTLRIFNRQIYGMAGIVSAGVIGSHYVSSGNTIWAASPSYADVVAAIALADPGGTVRIPAGSATWSSQLVISKALRLIGAGIGQTVITNAYSNSSGSLSESKGFILLKPSDYSLNPAIRISGFSIPCTGQSYCIMPYNRSDPAQIWDRIRIDHIAFSSHERGIRVVGHAYGVADNCTFSSGTIALSSAGSQAVSWNQLTYTLGTGNVFFYEDCVVNMSPSWDTQLDGGAGGRFVLRHSTVNIARSFSPLIDQHGNQSSGDYAGQGTELYENTFNNPGAYSGYHLNLRGGRAAVFNNNCVGGSMRYTIVEEHSDYIPETPPPVSPIDGQPQHVSDCYFFNNKLNGTVQYTRNPDVVGTVDYSAYGYSPGAVPTEDREFWSHKASFDGSSGVGVGLLAARPATCSLEGAGYWATDESKLYRWHSGAWELFYTPYTYPHPLRSDPILGD
jgi:hypothetical protein